jgi:anti-anti-sigma regulatory factor
MSVAVLSLPARLTVDQAALLKEQLLAQADVPGMLEIDGLAVDQAETAGLQLLLAFAIARQSGNLGLRWRGASESLRSAAVAMGISAQLELPAAGLRA